MITRWPCSSEWLAEMQIPPAKRSKNKLLSQIICVMFPNVCRNNFVSSDKIGVLRGIQTEQYSAIVVAIFRFREVNGQY